MAALLFVVWRLIQSHCCLPGKKTANDPSLPFQPPRRPTAVRSPSGQPTHYLKKSPSPNGSKPLPGHNTLLTPTGDSVPATPITHPQTALPGGFAASSIKYTEENEQTGHHLHHATHHPLSNGGIASKQQPADMAAGDVMHSSITSADGTTVDAALPEHGKLGALVFKLHYLTERNALVVSVVRCRGLPGKQLQQQATAMMASDGSCVKTTTTSATTVAGKSAPTAAAATDPYVKLQLLPEKQHKVKTRVVRNTRNPVYDEDFTFYGLSLAELSLMSLHFVVLSFDRYSRDDVIGEVVCALSGIDLSQIENQQVALSKEIQPRSLKVYRGLYNWFLINARHLCIAYRFAPRDAANCSRRCAGSRPPRD